MAKDGCTWRTRAYWGGLTVGILLAVGLLASPASAQSAPGAGGNFPLMVVERPFEQELLLQLQFDRFLIGDLFSGFLDGEALFVPFGLIARRQGNVGEWKEPRNAVGAKGLRSQY